MLKCYYQFLGGNNMSKSRKQCSVKDPKTGNYRLVKATDVGSDVYDKKTHELIGVLLPPNPNSNILRMYDLKKNKSVSLK